jgi:long-chain acyl-CoA synthetase
MKLDLVPTIQHEGKSWNFMGIFSKNREEWSMINLANSKTCTTTVAFYDTLGPAAVEFVINQTQLTSISCSENYVSGLLTLKAEGKANSLLNIISFDPVSEDLLSKAKELHIDLYTIG